MVSLYLSTSQLYLFSFFFFCCCLPYHPSLVLPRNNIIIQSCIDFCGKCCLYRYLKEDYWCLSAAACYSRCRLCDITLPTIFSRRISDFFFHFILFIIFFFLLFLSLFFTLLALPTHSYSPSMSLSTWEWRKNCDSFSFLSSFYNLLHFFSLFLYLRLMEFLSANFCEYLENEASQRNR